MWQHEISEAAGRQETLRFRLLSAGVLAAGWAGASALPGGAAGPAAERAALAAILALAGWFSAYHLGERRSWPVLGATVAGARHGSDLVTMAPLGALLALAVFGLGALPMVILAGLLLLALEQLD
ncbi:MAG TPA: hypothetical protein VNL71_11825 [Chloroflexota bacterium]|nr:hypothetical protein [Chloroflexota bacterium]